jgi:hypothetical protein
MSASSTISRNARSFLSSHQSIRAIAINTVTANNLLG